MGSSLLDIFDSPSSPKKEKPKKKKKKKQIIAESANPARDFINDLVFWIEHKRTETARAPGLHCSSLWRTCPRVPLLEIIHEGEVKRETFKAGQLMTFDEGHALHDLIQNSYCGPWGRLCGNWKCLHCQEIVYEGTMPESCPKCELPWRDPKDGSQNIVYAEMFVKDEELDYCGHCDGLILDRTLTKKRVFEFKTISKSQYNTLRQSKTAHIIQSHAYMHALGLDEAIIVYWDKASQCDWSRTSEGQWIAGRPHLKAYLVPFSDEIWAPMVVRIKAYHEARQIAKTLPTITADEVTSFRRVCSHDKCDLALDCGVREFCFRLPK